MSNQEQLLIQEINRLRSAIFAETCAYTGPNTFHPGWVVRLRLALNESRVMDEYEAENEFTTNSPCTSAEASQTEI